MQVLLEKFHDHLLSAAGGSRSITTARNLVGHVRMALEDLLEGHEYAPKELCRLLSVGKPGGLMYRYENGLQRGGKVYTYSSISVKLSSLLLLVRYILVDTSAIGTALSTDQLQRFAVALEDANKTATKRRLAQDMARRAGMQGKLARLLDSI